MCYVIEVSFYVKIIIQYSSIQISLSVSKGFIFFKRCSKTHYKCCVSQQRELIFTVFITMSNFPDSCRILIMIQLIAMCWPHFQAISFAVSSVITCPVHHCHNLPICVISCMNSITYRSPWTLQIFHSLSMSVFFKECILCILTYSGIIIVRGGPKFMVSRVTVVHDFTSPQNV